MIIPEYLFIIHVIIVSQITIIHIKKVDENL